MVKMRSNVKDKTGKRFGMLTAIEYLGHSRWLFKCDCGNVCARYNSSLTDHSHCGCQKKERIKQRARKQTIHGDSTTKLYKRWTGMHQRCSNPKSNRYEAYGARGITVCDEWDDYRNFKEWALANGYDENLSLDRIDVNGNYEPDNCRWATASVQSSNRRHHSRGKYLGKSIEAIDDCGNIVGRFDHIGEAADWLGRKIQRCSSIYRALSGERKTAYGYVWRYVS